MTGHSDAGVRNPLGEQLDNHLRSFQEAQSRLWTRLISVDWAQLDVSEYTRRYVMSQLVSSAYLGTFTQVLAQAANDWSRDLKEMSLLELGGGTGLQSLLAIEAGVGHVTFNDIYDGSCRDVAIIANAVGLEIPVVICGDAPQLVETINASDRVPDRVISYDVLEHIYDISSHFREMAKLNAGDLRLFYASGANAYNPRYVHQVKKIQIQVDQSGQDATPEHKDRDSLLPYRQIRSSIIRNAAPHLDDKTVLELAERSRGLRIGDIETAVLDPYLNGLPTYAPSHPTNTCDPMTGNWCEQLLSFEDINSMAKASGLRAQFGFGRYATSGHQPQDFVRRSLNLAMGMLGRHGLRLAPYYFVSLTRASKVSTNSP